MAQQQIDPEIAAIIKGCGLSKDALWTHKQSNKLIMYHWACEKAGAVKGVRWEPPQVIQADAANKLAVVLVTGKLGEATEWSFGEAAPYNTTQTYPFAMAEKRAKDRVILKLLGLHGEVYSEVESDDFRQNGAEAPTEPASARQRPAAASTVAPPPASSPGENRSQGNGRSGGKTPEAFAAAVLTADLGKLAELDLWLRTHGAKNFGNERAKSLAETITSRRAVLVNAP